MIAFPPIHSPQWPVGASEIVTASQTGLDPSPRADERQMDCIHASSTKSTARECSSAIVGIWAVEAMLSGRAFGPALTAVAEWTERSTVPRKHEEPLKIVENAGGIGSRGIGANTRCCNLKIGQTHLELRYRSSAPPVDRQENSCRNQEILPKGVALVYMADHLCR